MSENSSRGWIVTFAGTGINLALGVLYTWSIFAKALTDPNGAFAWSKTMASIPYTTAIALFAIMMVPAGRAQDKLGPKVVATAGGILVGGGLILSSFMSSVTGVAIGFGLLAGAGIGLGYASATPAAVKWFPAAKKGLITGLVVSGFGLAPVYIAPLTTYMIANFGVSQSFFILGVAFLVVIAGFSQLLAVPAATPAPAARPGSAPAPAAAGSNYVWQEMVKTPQFYLLWIMFACAAVSGLMIIGHIANIAKGQLPEMSASFASLLVALMAIFNAGGRIVAGIASDKIGRTRTMLLMFLIQAVVMASFSTFTSTTMLALGAGIVGFNYGAALSLFPSATSDFFGTQNLGANYGIVFTSWGVGGVFGPMLAGIVADANGGNYGMAFLIAAGLCVVAAGVAAITKPPQARSGASLAKGA